MAALAEGNEGKRSAPSLSKDAFAYASCFCEENAVRMQQKLSEQCGRLGSQFFVCFLSNGSGVLPLWRQQAGAEAKDGVVLWDYHVFVVELRGEASGDGSSSLSAETEAYVWDLDTTIEPFPCTLEEYVRCAIKPRLWLQIAESKHDYRVFCLCGKEALARFASDRRHMKLKRESAGRWVNCGTCVLPFCALALALFSCLHSCLILILILLHAHAHSSESGEVSQPNVKTAPAVAGAEGKDWDWAAPPPSWPLIRGEAADSAHTLPLFLQPAVEKEDEGGEGEGEGEGGEKEERARDGRSAADGVATGGGEVAAGDGDGGVKGDIQFGVALMEDVFCDRDALLKTLAGMC